MRSAGRPFSARHARLHVAVLAEHDIVTVAAIGRTSSAIVAQRIRLGFARADRARWLSVAILTTAELHAIARLPTRCRTILRRDDVAGATAAQIRSITEPRTLRLAAWVGGGIAGAECVVQRCIELALAGAAARFVPNQVVDLAIGEVAAVHGDVAITPNFTAAAFVATLTRAEQTDEQCRQHHTQRSGGQPCHSSFGTRSGHELVFLVQLKQFTASGRQRVQEPCRPRPEPLMCRRVCASLGRALQITLWRREHRSHACVVNRLSNSHALAPCRLLGRARRRAFSTRESYRARALAVVRSPAIVQRAS